jgi:hypothetical protein
MKTATQSLLQVEFVKNIVDNYVDNFNINLTKGACVSPLFLLSLYVFVMKKKETYQDKLDFNGGWSRGEAAHHIGKKTTEQSIKSKKTYSRKEKHKKDLTIS